MSWIPDPPVILVLLQKIEKGGNLLQDSSELFWRFYLRSMDPDEFKERTEFWINRQLEDSLKGGGFQDSEIRDYILSGPEKLSQVIIDKLDELSEKYFVSYHPDEKEGPVVLHVHLCIEACRLARFLKLEQDEWPNEEQEIEVRDSKGEAWSLPEYWQHAAGWAEAQLQPSELRDLLNEREDQAAETRLRTYFFGEKLWDKLPERARRSIVSADRDWFSGSVARTESILNELQIATIELLIYRLWNPMGEWLKRNNTKNIDTSKYDELVYDLKSKNRSLTALDLERTCRMPVTVKYLTSKGISESDLEWITRVLPTSIFKLRQARNRAEHVSDSQIEREELNRFYNEFIGIGQTGIIRKISELINAFDDKTDS